MGKQIVRRFALAMAASWLLVACGDAAQDSPDNLDFAEESGDNVPSFAAPVDGEPSQSDGAVVASYCVHLAEMFEHQSAFRSGIETDQQPLLVLEASTRDTWDALLEAADNAAQVLNDNRELLSEYDRIQLRGSAGEFVQHEAQLRQYLYAPQPIPLAPSLGSQQVQEILRTWGLVNCGGDSRFEAVAPLESYGFPSVANERDQLSQFTTPGQEEFCEQVPLALNLRLFIQEALISGDFSDPNFRRDLVTWGRRLNEAEWQLEWSFDVAFPNETHDEAFRLASPARIAIELVTEDLPATEHEQGIFEADRRLLGLIAERCTEHAEALAQHLPFDELALDARTRTHGDSEFFVGEPFQFDTVTPLGNHQTWTVVVGPLQDFTDEAVANGAQPFGDFTGFAGFDVEMTLLAAEEDPTWLPITALDFTIEREDGYSPMSGNFCNLATRFDKHAELAVGDAISGTLCSDFPIEELDSARPGIRFSLGLNIAFDEPAG